LFAVVIFSYNVLRVFCVTFYDIRYSNLYKSTGHGLLIGNSDSTVLWYKADFGSSRRV